MSRETLDLRIARILVQILDRYPSTEVMFSWSILAEGLISGFWERFWLGLYGLTIWGFYLAIWTSWLFPKEMTRFPFDISLMERVAGKSWTIWRILLNPIFWYYSKGCFNLLTII